jgi:serine/threonine-protein kinase HipA
MEREIHVYMDVDKATVLVGRLWARDKQGIETATFMYDTGWLKRPGAIPLSPTLMLTPGPFQSDKGLFGAFSDAAPDRWGKKLMRHHERERAKLAGTKPRKLLEADFLLGVDDEIRLGALRFKVPKEDRFLSSSNKPVPPLVDLKKLLSAADRIEKGKEKKGDLDLLLAPAGSLGGARPKAVIRDKDGALALAKFPWKQDDWSVILWEKLTLDLAQNAGIKVAKYRLELKGAKSILMIARFDRGAGQARIPYMSAMTALGASDHSDERSYLEIVDVLRQIGGSPEQDLQQLWRRVVFNILVSNTDDHPRNHGLLLGPKGWRLSPAFDMNPCPADISGRIHIMAINEEDRSGSLELALSVAEYFGLSLKDAKKISGEIGLAVSKWRNVASSMKISESEIERIESAFAHDDLQQALANRVAAAAPKGPAKRPASKGRARKAA